MKIHNFIALIAFISIASSLFAHADFDAGMKFMKQKEYQKANESFKKVTKEDPYNASAFYNQGHCYFEMNKFGDAIYCFEKALQYDPKNSNCIKNLEVCHFKLEQPSYEPIHSGTMRSLFAFGGNNWSMLAIVSAVILALLIAAFKNRKTTNGKRFILVASIFSIILGSAFSWFAYVTHQAFHHSNHAIVVDKSIPTYDPTGAKTEFPIAEGTRIQIIGPAEKGKISAQLSNEQEVLIDGTGWLKL